jgi:hypothetical protein
MATLATILDRMARYEPAATIAGCASTPFTVATYPELLTTTAHLRTVLGDQAYESLARTGEAMTTAAMATYAYDQIDQARAELTDVSQDEFRGSQDLVSDSGDMTDIVGQQ